MAQMRFVGRGSLRYGRRARRMIGFIRVEGLFSPIISICHVAQLLTLSSSIRMYYDIIKIELGSRPVQNNGFNGQWIARPLRQVER